MKKLLTILLSFSVLLFSTQTVCVAMPLESAASGCESSHCCSNDDGAEGEEETPSGNMKKDGSCCIYNVLSTHQAVSFTMQQVHALQLKTGFLEAFLINQFAADFWQPPRA